MALLYRAIWSDGRPDLVDAALPVFREWVARKELDVTVPEDGLDSAGGAEVAVARVEDGETRALRTRLVEERPVAAGEERWTTTTHWMTNARDGWVWVDLEWVSDDTFAREPEVVAPNLVGMLLKTDGADRGHVRLGPEPSRVSVDEVDDLVSWLYDDERPNPVVVFSVDKAIDPEAYSGRVRETARRLAGCVDVRMLTVESEAEFDRAMSPTSMSVFHGAARVYLPGIDESDPQPWRHRYIRARFLSDRPWIAAGRIARVVLPRIVAQRPPVLYRTHVKQLLDATLGEQTDWEAMALELDETVSRLQQENEGLREEKDLALMEALDSERRAADAIEKLEALRQRFRIMGEAPEAIEQEESDEAISASSCAEAVQLGQTLDNIVIHPDAPQDIDRMDQSPDSELWGQRVWMHLQSLNAYAEEKGPGFETWCRTSGHPRVISPKFISMTESETVCNNPRLRERRLLPIDMRVDPSGRIEMLAHIKSVEGGGMQIPRVYFFDDTKGVTGKIHVGFIGPHDLMPNTKTN